jgi:chromosome segregation ATPase
MKKFDDLKRIVSVINSVISLPADIQHGVLSTQKINVEKALENLKVILERYESEKLKGEQILLECRKHALAHEEELRISKIEYENIARDRDELLKAVSAMKEDHVRATEAFNAELQELHAELIGLQERHKSKLQESMAKSSRMLRSGYDVQISNLKSKLEEEVDRSRALATEKSKLAIELKKARNELIRAASDIDEKNSTIIEKEREEKKRIDDLYRQLQDKEKQLASAERQIQTLAMKVKQKDEQISTLHNLLEKNMKSLNRSVDEVQQNASALTQKHMQLSQALNTSGL